MRSRWRRKPLLLIADEPTTALDVTVQAQVLDLLADIQREMGMAVLLITHDLAVVKNVAHHVALMRGGEIVESASAEEFFRAPKHPYARQLFEAIPTFEKRGTPLTEQRRQAMAREDGRAAGQRAARKPGDVVLDVQDLKAHYPVRKGPLRRIVSWVKAVDGVTFSLRAGETLALLGESGCGKTTTGKALLRLIEGARISGRAMLQGKDALSADRRTLRDLRQDIQIVFQDPYASLDPRMRVGDILDEGLASLRRGMSKEARAAHAAQLIERVGLPVNTLTRYPHEFSGGQRQRIAIARALAVEPKSPDLRRTHVCARRFRAGADPGPVARASGRNWVLPTCSSRTISAWLSIWRIASPSWMAGASSNWGRPMPCCMHRSRN